MHIGIEYLYFRIADDAAGGNFALALSLDAYGLGSFAVKLGVKSLDVEDDFGYILFNALDGGKFVLNSVDLNGDYSYAGKRGEQNSSQAVAQRDTETAVKRLCDKLAVTAVFRKLRGFNLGLYNFNHNITLQSSGQYQAAARSSLAD